MFNLGALILTYDKLTLIDNFKSRLKFTSYDMFYQDSLTFNLQVKVKKFINFQYSLMYIKGHLASLILLSQKFDFYEISLLKTWFKVAVSHSLEGSQGISSQYLSLNNMGWYRMTHKIYLIMKLNFFTVKPITILNLNFLDKKGAKL